MKAPKCLAALAALVLLAAQSRAGFVATFVVDGRISGTWQGRSFTNAPVTFTLTYYTDDVMGGYFGTPDRFPPFLPPWSASVSGTGTVSVEGVGSAGLGHGGVGTYSSNLRNPPQGATLTDFDLVFAGSTAGRPDLGEFVMFGGWGNAYADYDLRS